ncbi:MAG: NAD-dependent epimerase/dehydratase family protein [Candidatus Liptonbacteria bacterium]|nr:NAD-dependent epimerase/dehydratase family protein [Candidatus Liptonbacteria bacterium]
MKIIVTGGAGFIGSHIVDAYIKAGHRVAVIDNLLTGFKKNLNPKAKFYKADIKNLALMEKIFRRERPEIVSHHAAIAEVVKSLRNPLPTLGTNVLGTTNVLLAFGKYGAGKNWKFIFSSTGGAIYGEPKKIPADERTPAIPLSPYGLSKLLGEELIKFYSRQYGFDYLIFRYPNVYGPRQNPKGEAGVVAIFGGIMKRNIRPTIFGDGTKARDYVYVGDIARANIIVLKRRKNEIINLGWGKMVTDQTIFDAIAEETGFSASGGKETKPIYAPYRKGEVYRIAIDARRAKKILGWRPSVKLKDGIRKTLATIH